MTIRACLLSAVFPVLLAGAGNASAQAYDVLCDTVAGTAYCHPAHPQGKVWSYAELRKRVDGFGAGRMSVVLASGETRFGRDFGLLDSAVRFGTDTIPLHETRFLYLRSSWPQWSSVASLAAGGMLMFGGVGLVIDGVQWMAGGEADLVATSRGGLVGAILFGGLGLAFARDELGVRIQPGKSPETVSVPPTNVPSTRVASSGIAPRATQATTTKSAW